MSEDAHPALLMFIAQRHAEGRILAALHGAGFADLTLAQARLAARVGPGGTRVTELAEAAQVAKQTATALLDRLEAAGYVERVPDPVDARARLVRLGERGLAALPVARAEEAAIEAEWAAHLGPRRMAQLTDALLRLREITDPYAAG